MSVSGSSVSEVEVSGADPVEAAGGFLAAWVTNQNRGNETMKKNVASQVTGSQMITALDGSDFTGAVSVFFTIDGGSQTAGAGTAPAHEGNGLHSYTPPQSETNGDNILFTFTGTGAITSTVQIYTTFPQSADNDVLLSDLITDVADVPTVAEFNARTRLDADYFSWATDDVAVVTLVDTVTLTATTTTNTDMVSEPLSASATANAVWDELKSSHTDADTFGDYLDTEVSGVSGTGLSAQATRDAMKLAPSVGAPSTGSIDDQLSDIDGDTGTALPAQITALNDLAATDILSDGTALNTTAGVVDTVTLTVTTTNNTDMVVAPDNAGITANGVAIGALNDFNPASDTVANVTTVATTTTNTDMVSEAPSLTDIENQIWNAQEGDHTAVNSFGYNLDSQVSLAGGGSLTEGGIAAAVWDLNRTGHTGINTFGLFLDEQITSITGGSLTVPGIVDGVYNAVTASYTANGSFGKLFNDSIVDTGTDIPAQITASFTEIKGATWSGSDTLEGIYDQTVTIDTAIGNLNDIEAADIVTAGPIATLSGDVVSVSDGAKATALATAQTDLDTITGSNGVTVASLQPNYNFGTISKGVAFPNYEFPMVLDDGESPGLGLTVTGQRSLDGAAFTNMVGGISEISNGVYKLNADATDTNGDFVMWRFSAVGARDTLTPFIGTS